MSIIDNAKVIYDLAKKSANLELQEAAMSFREQALAFHEENLRLKERIKELEIEKELIYEQPYYWQEKDGNKEGPYCQRCYDKEKQLIRLQAGDKGEWRCMVCGGYYTDSSYRDDGPSAITPQGYF